MTPLRWLAAAVVLVSLLLSAINMSLRQFSRARMAERLGRWGRERLLEGLVAHQTELRLISSALRMTTNLILILLIVRLLEPPEVSYGFMDYVWVFAVTAAIMLVFSVAIPNAWARHAPESLLITVLPMLQLVRRALFPLAAFLRLFDELVRRLLGAPRSTEQDEAEQREQEILNAVSEGKLSGAVDEEEEDMIESVMELRERHCGEIMTPRTDIVAVASTATLVEIKELIAREGHSRLPVFNESLDAILGVLYAKDLLQIGDRDDFDPTEVMRKVPFVPETKFLRDLLREFRERKVHMAIVLDEYGGTAGLVTIEDILEELVGEIVDEYEPPSPEPICRIDEDTIEVDARVNIHQLNDELDISLPEHGVYDTVGGLVFSALGKIPDTGEEFAHENLRITVLDAEERKINRVLVRVVRETEPAAE